MLPAPAQSKSTRLAANAEMRLSCYEYLGFIDLFGRCALWSRLKFADSKTCFIPEKKFKE